MRNCSVACRAVWPSKDSSKEIVQGAYDLDTALNLHCGALSVVVESPTHGATHAKVGDQGQDGRAAQVDAGEEEVGALGEALEAARIWPPPGAPG